MMEPAGLAKPVIVGPHTFNFNEEVQILKESDAIKIVQDEASLLNELMYLLEHPYEARGNGEEGAISRNETKGRYRT